MQLVVGHDEVPQVHQALEVGVVQGGEAVGVQVEGVEVMEVSEGVRPDLTDGVSAQGQVDLEMQMKCETFTPQKTLDHFVILDLPLLYKRRFKPVPAIL